MNRFIIRTEEDKEGVVAAIMALPLFSPLSVEITEYKPASNQSQQHLFFKWMDEVASFRLSRGWEPELIIEGVKYRPSKLMRLYFQRKFLPSETTIQDLDTGEMSRFMQMVEQDCNNIGISLTIPKDSVYYKNQKTQGEKI